MAQGGHLDDIQHASEAEFDGLLHVPSEQDLREANEAFETLRNGLARDPPPPLQDEEPSAGEMSARAARDEVRPVVIVMKSGAFCMGLQAQNEVLGLVAFGSISTETYHDMVWEELQKIPGWNRSEVGVYEVEKKPNLRFLIRCKKVILELKYFQCRDLVRKYPDVASNTASFELFLSKDAENSSEDVRKAVEEVTQSKHDKSEFCRQDAKQAYFYLRAWAIARGYFGVTSNNDLVRLCCESLPTQDTSENPFDFTVRTALRHYIARQNPNLGIEPHPENYVKSWAQLLDTLQNRTRISNKMGASQYLIISVMHTGCSNLQAGQWLTYVKLKLGQLKEVIKVIVPNQSDVSLWPYRLVEQGADPDASDYEGFFILGVYLNVLARDEDSQILEAAEKWTTKIRKNDLTIPNHCFINLICESASDFEKRDLKPCPRIPSRPFLISDVTIEGQEEEDQTKEKRPKKNVPTKPSHPIPDEQPVSKLRMASDIHNRLKHDSRYKIDEYVIGYEDRVAGKIMEKAAADWLRETTERDFIPEQRVRYFKRYVPGAGEEVVWDRGTRLDRVFGSGRGLEGEK